MSRKLLNNLKSALNKKRSLYFSSSDDDVVLQRNSGLQTNYSSSDDNQTGVGSKQVNSPLQQKTTPHHQKALTISNSDSSSTDYDNPRPGPSNILKEKKEKET